MRLPRHLKVVAIVVAGLGWTLTVLTLAGASWLAGLLWLAGALAVGLAALVHGPIPRSERRSRDRDDGDDWEEGGGGGGGPRPDGEPPWWPDFEREFREHTRARERGRAPGGPSYLRRR